MDGDGKLDVVAGGRCSGSLSPVAWYKNNDDQELTYTRIVIDNDGPTEWVHTVDFNQVLTHNFYMRMA